MLGPSWVTFTNAFVARTVAGALARTLWRLVTEAAMPALVLMVQLQTCNSRVALDEALGALTLAVLG